MRDAQLRQVGVERDVVLDQAVRRAHGLAHAQAAGDDRGGVLLRQCPRRVGEVVRRVRAPHVLVDLRAQGVGHDRAVGADHEVELQRSGAENRRAGEDLVVLHAEARRAHAAHAEPFDDAARARGDGAVTCVDQGQQLAHQHGFDRSRAVLRVGPHAVVPAVREHDDQRRHLAFRHGVGEPAGERRHAGGGWTRTVQPVEHRKTPRRFGVVVGRRPNVKAHRRAGCGAGEGAVLDARRDDRTRVPLSTRGGRKREGDDKKDEATREGQHEMGGATRQE